MSLVSVVMPTFNAHRTVLRAARSILQQTHKRLELIAVDDGSTDGTVTQLESLNDSRLRIITQPHQGVATTANIGAEHAQGDIIARMDADDFSHPTRIAAQLAHLIEYDFDAVGCQTAIVDAAGHAVPTMQRYEKWINEDTLDSGSIHAMRFVELPLVNPTVLAKRAYFDLGFRNNDFPEDYDLLLRACACGMRFGKAPHVLFDWTDHAQRLTRNDPRYTNDAFEKCRRMHLLAGPLRDAASVDLWGVGKTGKPWLRFLQQNDINIRRSYDVNPRTVGREIHNTPVFHPDEMPLADGTPMVVAVGAAGARELILPHLASRGHEPGRDTWFVA